MVADRNPRDNPSRAVAALALLAVFAASCGGMSDAVRDRLDDARADLEYAVEDGLEYQPPPPMSEHEALVRGVVAEHRQVSGEMIHRAAEVGAVATLVATFLLPEGPVDLLLTIVPVGKVGKGLELMREARKLRKRSKKRAAAAKLDEGLNKLDPVDRDFVRRVAALDSKTSKALYRIHERTGSEKLTRRLLDQYEKDAVVIQWIEQRLARGKLEPATVRRFTFDADFVQEFTLHSANPSWATLVKVVEGTEHVDAATRASLASKLAGVLGEQAAARVVATPAFTSRYTTSSRFVVVERGLGYGEGRSLDIAAYTENYEAIFVEVKNWSIETWNDKSKRKAVLDQLDAHDRGIAYIRHNASETRKEAARVLMIRKEPFTDELRRDIREEFEQLVAARGWKIEYIPARDIPDVGDVIDALR